MEILYLDENLSDLTLLEIGYTLDEIAPSQKDPVALYDTCERSFSWLEANYSQYQTIFVDDEGDRLIYYVIPYEAFIELKTCQDVELKNVLA
jgi:hypothetical protein